MPEGATLLVDAPGEAAADESDSPKPAPNFNVDAPVVASLGVFAAPNKDVDGAAGLLMATDAVESVFFPNKDKEGALKPTDGAEAGDPAVCLFPNKLPAELDGGATEDDGLSLPATGEPKMLGAVAVLRGWLAFAAMGDPNKLGAAPGMGG